MEVYICWLQSEVACSFDSIRKFHNLLEGKHVLFQVLQILAVALDCFCVIQDDQACLEVFILLRYIGLNIVY